MNLNQKQTILDTLQKIQDINIKRLLLEAYPDASDFKTVMISKFNGADFIYMLNKLINQFKSELESKYGFLLPATENFGNEFGTVNLNQDLQNLYAQINAKQFVQGEPFLEKLIHYQIKNDFWNKSDVKNLTISSEDLKEQIGLIEINQKAIDKNIKSFTDLKSKMELEISSAKELLSAKKIELNEITDLLTSARAQISSINDTASSATIKDTEISGILKNLNEKVSLLTETIGTNKDDFTIIKSDSSALVESLKSTLEFASLNMEKTKSDIAFVESKKKEIETLTGMAADGSLGSKFNQRKIDLTTSVNYWTLAVIIVTILAAGWIYIVFVVLNAGLSNEWINLLVNVIKTSPAFILVGFVFSRYSKERTLQEEYAFKSAIAMTLTAYSQMLESEDSDENVSRQQMLLKSIEMIYTQPRLYNEKTESLSLNVVKQLKETVDTLTESVKNIKNI